MNCPRDQHELKDRVLEEMPVHKCLDCFGIWVSKQAIVALATARQIRPLMELMEANYLPIMSLPRSKMRCPIDDTFMHFNVIHNIEIDMCPICRGIWLDRGEFDSVTFRERLNWDEREKSEDNFLKIFFDTVSYPSENPGLIENLLVDNLERLKKIGRYDELI